MSDTFTYLAPEADRVPVAQVAEGTRVSVPVWKSGTVTGWTTGTVVQVQDPGTGVADVFYIVRHDVTGQEVGYFYWSLARPV